MSPASATSLVPADNAFALLAVFFGITAIGALLEKTRLGRRVSGVMLVIAIAIVLAHFRIIPASAPVYGAIWTYLVPLAIALFLLRADLVSIVVEGGRTLVAFLFGAVGVAAGAWLGAQLLDLGPFEAQYAAVFSATYVGGSLNFAAVADAIGFRDPSALAAGVAIDNVVGLGYLLMVGAAASWAVFRRHFAWRAHRLTEAVDQADTAQRVPTVIDLALALGLAALACAAGTAIADALGQSAYAILYITLLMVAIATLGRRWLRTIAGPELAATLFMYLFFALLGAGADIGAMLGAAPALFAYVLIIFAVHILFILAGARLCRLNHAEIVIASSACIGGPPIAIAFAVLFGWRRLAVPAVATGVLGYVLGNFVGIGLFESLAS
ncbi:conserved membrane hypothetical protein [Luteimonas sp. 9C]|uniref:DUF819 family protein n=1 Tax=Luteimonas sp. 9C TaxID=2653148 RepID=UPI0012F44B4B|nr:DUF819 family protein [Luteimonas sp. 9C]VXB13079.1 conserved membrane hypothetical protein [Luteimonas sp. 9C]